MCGFVLLCVCVCVHHAPLCTSIVCTCVCACTLMCLHKNVCLCVRVCVYVHACVRACGCVSICTVFRGLRWALSRGLLCHSSSVQKALLRTAQPSAALTHLWAGKLSLHNRSPDFILVLVQLGLFGSPLRHRFPFFPMSHSLSPRSMALYMSHAVTCSLSLSLSLYMSHSPPSPWLSTCLSPSLSLHMSHSPSTCLSLSLCLSTCLTLCLTLSLYMPHCLSHAISF